MKLIWRRKNSWVIYYPGLRYKAMAIWPFIFIRERKFANDEVIMNHERIHHRQQLRWFIIPFYLIYVFSYLFNLIKYKNHDKAYRNIPFEKEAYEKERLIEI